MEDTIEYNGNTYKLINPDDVCNNICSNCTFHEDFKACAKVDCFDDIKNGMYSYFVKVDTDSRLQQS